MSLVSKLVIFHFHHDWRKSSATGFQFSLKESTFRNHAAFHTYTWVYLKNPRFSQSNPVGFWLRVLYFLPAPKPLSPTVMLLNRILGQRGSNENNSGKVPRRSLENGLCMKMDWLAILN